MTTNIPDERALLLVLFMRIKRATTEITDRAVAHMAASIGALVITLLAWAVLGGALLPWSAIKNANLIFPIISLALIAHQIALSLLFKRRMLQLRAFKETLFELGSHLKYKDQRLLPAIKEVNRLFEVKFMVKHGLS